MDDKDTSLLTEYSKLINELVNARRELARLNATLSERERFLSRILAMSPSVVYLYDMKIRTYVFTSRPLVSLLGFEGEEKEIEPEGDPDLIDIHRASIGISQEGVVQILEFQAFHADGSRRWLRTKETVFSRDSTGLPEQVLGVMDDVTLPKEREEALRKDSTIDPLTGLLNRRGFLASASILLQSSSLRRSPCALLFFDLDGFKKINDVYGHADGDAALKMFSDGLRKAFRSSDVLGRFGGDEFVVLSSDVTADNLASLLERMNVAMHSSDTRKERSWTLDWSTGHAFFSPGDRLELDKLIADADASMYENKMRKSLSRTGNIS